jgi:nucleotidyltransferase/DNA polymerase involved in DNA repair
MQAQTSNPAAYGKNLLTELRYVPKPALRAVFGDGFGRRIWELTRHQDEHQRPTSPTPGALTAMAVPHGLTEPEIVSGMIEYVSRRAAETLAEEQRQAKAIGLRLLYADGLVHTQRTRLARPTSDSHELSAAAIDLFHRAPARKLAVVSVSLTGTTVQAEAVHDSLPRLRCALANA